MGSMSIWHWLIVLVIVMLVFGTKKLKNIGGDLGAAVKSFKEGVREATDENPCQRQQHGPGHPAQRHQRCLQHGRKRRQHHRRGSPHQGLSRRCQLWCARVFPVCFLPVRLP